MKKIPTIFQRDWNGDRSRVTEEVNPECQWVFDGEGVATHKLDGTCCMIRAEVLFKRRELKPGQDVPEGFEPAMTDAETGKTVGWMPVDASDKWHIEAFQRLMERLDGTYELIGPKVQGNPENASNHILVPHSDPVLTLPCVPRSFAGLRDWLAAHNLEGVVFHHPDGRMAKIKGRDFGLRRTEGEPGQNASAIPMPSNPPA